MKLCGDIKISYRITALVLCIALMLSCLVGCDDKDKGKDDNTSKANTSQTSGKSTVNDNTSSSTSSSSTYSKVTSTSSPIKTTRKTTVKTTRVPTTKAPVANAPYAAPIIYSTVASGTVVYSNSKAAIDASNTKDGYIMAKYTGSIAKIKLQIIKDTTYTYDLSTSGNYEVFPLSMGSGTYTVRVLENVSGTSYSVALSTSISVSISNQFAPFLRPNQYVNYNGRTTAVLKAAELCTGYSSTDLKKLDRIYNFVINYFTYDYNKAETVQSGYVPNLNTVYAQRKGICFDYAAVMTAMLRSQNIPCKLVIGYAKQDMYHAWINVYIRTVGWINGAIYFDGKSWKLMDPTFASTGKSSASVMNYINNTSNYSAMYQY